MTTRRRAQPDRATVLKDWSLFGLGFILIVWQGLVLSKDEFNWIVLAAGVGLTQAPGAMAMLGLLRTNGGSSESAPPELPPPPVSPSSPSPSVSGGEPA
jgi:hypothetical protein